MKYCKEEQILLKKLIEKYCEIEDRNRLIKSIKIFREIFDFKRKTEYNNICHLDVY